MKKLNLDQLLKVQGGATATDCANLLKASVLTCAFASVGGWFTAAVFGPSCVGTAIAYAASC